LYLTLKIRNELRFFQKKKELWEGIANALKSKPKEEQLLQERYDLLKEGHTRREIRMHQELGMALRKVK